MGRPPPIIRAMPETKRFFLIEVFPYLQTDGYLLINVSYTFSDHLAGRCQATQQQQHGDHAHWQQKVLKTFARLQAILDKYALAVILKLDVM